METTDEDDVIIVKLWPEWRYGSMLLSGLDLSPETRNRLREWNEIWEHVLNPISEIRWPDVDVGRKWYREGLDLIRTVQQEVGPRFRIVNGFSAYDPDAKHLGS